MADFANPVILLGGEPVNSLGVMRNLGRMGVKVYYVSEGRNVSIFSKYCKKHFIVPNIEHNSKVLKTFLSKIRKELENRAVIFPSTDLFCLNLSSIKSEIEDGYHAILPKHETVETLINKKKFYHSLSKHKIPHPRTYFPESFEDIGKIDRKISYPVFVKPSVSQVFYQMFHKKGFLVKSKEELERNYRTASKIDRKVMIQEIIPGPVSKLIGINGCFDRKNNPLGWFAYRKIREWPIFGSGTLVESIPISTVPLMKKTIERYLHGLGYYGIIDAEFKVDSRDGSFKLIEINPRSWWQNTLPAKCGINLFFMAYLDAIGEDVNCNGGYKTGVKWIHSFNDLQASVKMLLNGEMKVSEWVSTMNSINDWAYLSMDDPMPWIMRFPFTAFSRV